MSDTSLTDLSKGVAEAPKEAVRGLTNWTGLTKFVQSFPDPMLALIAISVIALSVGAVVITFIWNVCSVLKARIEADRQIRIELARRPADPVEVRSRMIVIIPITIASAVVCLAVIVLIIVLSAHAKADYANAVIYTREFVDRSERIRAVMPEDQYAAAKPGLQKIDCALTELATRLFDPNLPTELEKNLDDPGEANAIFNQVTRALGAPGVRYTQSADDDPINNLEQAVTYFILAHASRNRASGKQLRSLAFPRGMQTTQLVGATLALVLRPEQDREGVSIG